MEIWQEIKKDKERGARRLVAEYGNRIFAAALLLSSNDLDAEELTFKTLGRAVEKIHLFDPEKSFFTWLYTIMLNLHRMELRKKRLPIIPVGASSDLPEVACDSFAVVLGNAEVENVTEAVRSLSRMLVGFFKECFKRNRTNKRKNTKMELTGQGLVLMISRRHWSSLHALPLKRRETKIRR